MTNDKPGIVAQGAQQAAAIAKEASDTLSAIPGVPNKGIVLHVIAGVGVAAGAVVAITTLGGVPGVVASLGAVAAYVVGWLNPTPTAVAQFGQSAK